MSKKVAYARLSRRVDRFRKSLHEVDYSICMQAAGFACVLGDGCGRKRIIKGIDLCDESHPKKQIK